MGIVSQISILFLGEFLLVSDPPMPAMRPCMPLSRSIPSVEWSQTAKTVDVDQALVYFSPISFQLALNSLSMEKHMVACLPDCQGCDRIRVPLVDAFGWLHPDKSVDLWCRDCVLKAFDQSPPVLGKVVNYCRPEQAYRVISGLRNGGRETKTLYCKKCGPLAHLNNGKGRTWPTNVPVEFTVDGIHTYCKTHFPEVQKAEGFPQAV